jgi:predicted nucleic acid-binding protein
MHSDAAWTWFSRQDSNRFFFCPFTQVGLLRLLATSAVMGKDVRTIGEAWKVYDRWLEDSRVGILREAFELDAAFRAATRPISSLSSPKALGDCYLLAVSQVTKRNAIIACVTAPLRSRLGNVRERVYPQTLMTLCLILLW